MTAEKHICAGKNKAKGYVGMFMDYSYGASRRNCNKNATVFENGKWYCKRHAPSAIKAREEKSWNNYMEKIRLNQERNKKNNGSR